MELFLQILSTAGFALLIILLVIAALIALILFLPVVYRIKIKKEDAFDLNGNVRWLFGAVRFSFLFDGKELTWKLRLFGFKLAGSRDEKKTGAVSGNEKFEPAKKQPTIMPGERVDGTENRASEPMKRESARRAESRGADGISRVKEEEAFEEAREPSLFEKIRFTFKSICDKLKKIKEFKAVFDKIKPMLVRIIKSVMPKKICGYIDFGFEDPASTGMLCAALGALCIPIPEGLKVTPYFNEKKFACDVKMKGRIFIIIILVNAVKILRVPEIKKLLKDALPPRKGGKKRRKYKKK